MESPLDRILRAAPPDDDDAERAESALRLRLLRAQDELVERDFPVLVEFAGPDFTGCEESYELLHEWLDSRDLRGEAFEPDGDASTVRPWLWRFWRNLPPKGKVGIWLRGWTTQALEFRLRDEWSDHRLEHALAGLRTLEAMLVADGALLIKIWLELPRQLLLERLDAARRKGLWRASVEDARTAELYGDRRPTIEYVLRATDSPHAPWTVIDGSDRRAREFAVAEQVAAALEARLAGPRTQVTVSGSRPAALQPRTAAEPPRLADLDMTRTLDEDAYDARYDELRDRLIRLHRRAHEQGIAAVIAFEGVDAAGKGGAIRRVARAMDALNTRVFAIAAPSERDRSRPWLWRFWTRVPRDGHVSIFDRSWYGRVLVERVMGFAEPDEWQRAYAEIEDFEAQLVDDGQLVVKFYLQVSPDEQLRRFEARHNTPLKRHKLTDDDWRNRARRAEFDAAAEDMFARTSGVVRWQLVPADDKRFARISVLETLCEAHQRILDD